MRWIPLLSLSAIVASSLMGYTSTDGCRPTADNYYGDRERGWFYSESPCVPVDQNKTVESKSSEKPLKKQYKLVAKVVEIPWDLIDQIDPEEIAKMERDAQKVAMMYPTDHNVKQHRLLQKYVMNKAVEYSKFGDRLGRKDTDLARWKSGLPQTTYANTVKVQKAYKDAEEVLKAYSQKAGLIVITQQGCMYCEKQIPILNKLKRETGFTYKEVDMAQAPEIVTKLGIARTPDIFLVFNKNGKPLWQRVASGLNTLDEIEQAILMGLYELGELKDDSLIYK